MSPEDVEQLGISVGSSKSRAIIETLAMLIGVRLWLWQPSWKEHRVSLILLTESTVSPGARTRERSSNAVMNAVVREMSLNLAKGKYHFTLVEHLPREFNVRVDA